MFKNSIPYIAIITLFTLLLISVFSVIPASTVLSVTNLGQLDQFGQTEYESDYESVEQSNVEHDNKDFVETVQMTTNLLADAKTAEQKQVPILILFSQESCGFCEIVRSDFLRPMLLNRDYDNKVLIRQMEFDGDDVIGFDGQKVDMDTFMEPYNVGFTPTVIFLDSKGNELTEQIIGITTVHFYGGFLDDNIDLSLKKLRIGSNLITSN